MVTTSRRGCGDDALGAAVPGTDAIFSKKSSFPELKASYLGATEAVQRTLLTTSVDNADEACD
jgi:hypothetical protein